MRQPYIQRERDLPQGPSSSVALADILASCLLWRIRHTHGVTPVAYVDDINFCANSYGTFQRVAEEVMLFSKSFALDIADRKTVVCQTAIHCGCAYVGTLSSLGAQCLLDQSSPLPLTRNWQVSRIQEVTLRHLPAHVYIKASAISKEPCTCSPT